MKKNVLMGVAAFGGLLLVVSLLPETPQAEVTNEPTEEVATLTLPNGVANFPTYPGAQVTKSSETTNDEGKVFYSFSLVTTDPISEINDWYRKALSQGGWKIKSDKNVAGYQIIQSENGNLYTSMQAANGEKGTAVISQQAQVRPE